MRYLTARKRAEGKGSAHSGTEHHWYMTVSGIGLAILMPIFIFMFGISLGGTHEEVIATFSRPFPAIITGLVIFVGFQHFMKGAQTMIEDYVHGTTRKALIIFVITLSYFLMAAGLFALAKIAL